MSVKWKIPCRGASDVVRCHPLYAAWRKTFLTAVYCFVASKSFGNDKLYPDSDYCTEKWSPVVMQVAKIARSSRREIPPLLFVDPKGSTYNCLEAQLDDDVVTNFEKWHKDITTIKSASDASRLDRGNSSYCVADIGTYQRVKIIGVILPIEDHILDSSMCENAIRNSINFIITRI